MSAADLTLYAQVCNGHALHLQERLDVCQRWYDDVHMLMPDGAIYVLAAGLIELEQRMVHYRRVVADACAPWFEAAQ